MSKKYENRLEVLQDIADGTPMDEIINSTDKSNTKGFLFEVISIICILMKCLFENYTEISDTNIETTPLIFRPIKSCREILDQKITYGDNKADISVNINGTWVAFSIKYGSTKRKSDLQECKQCLDSSRYDQTYSLGLIYENDDFLTKHRRKGNCEKIAIDIAKKINCFLINKILKKHIVKYKNY